MAEEKIARIAREIYENVGGTHRRQAADYRCRRHYERQGRRRKNPSRRNRRPSVQRHDL